MNCPACGRPMDVDEAQIIGFKPMPADRKMAQISEVDKEIKLYRCEECEQTYELDPESNDLKLRDYKAMEEERMQQLMQESELRPPFKP